MKFKSASTIITLSPRIGIKALHDAEKSKWFLKCDEDYFSGDTEDVTESQTVVHTASVTVAGSVCLLSGFD